MIQTPLPSLGVVRSVSSLRASMRISMTTSQPVSMMDAKRDVWVFLKILRMEILTTCEGLRRSMTPATGDGVPHKESFSTRPQRTALGKYPAKSTFRKVQNLVSRLLHILDSETETLLKRLTDGTHQTCRSLQVRAHTVREPPITSLSLK